MADVFLSYARATQARIEQIGGALEGSGYSLWWDKALNASDDYAMVIEAELDAASCVVVAWSAPARQSLSIRASSCRSTSTERGSPSPSVRSITSISLAGGASARARRGASSMRASPAASAASGSK